MDVLARDHLRQLADELRYASSERLRTLAEGCLELLDATEHSVAAEPEPQHSAPAHSAPVQEEPPPPPTPPTPSPSLPNQNMRTGGKLVQVTCWCREMHLWQEMG